MFLCPKSAKWHSLCEIVFLTLNILFKKVLLVLTLGCFITTYILLYKYFFVWKPTTTTTTATTTVGEKKANFLSYFQRLLTRG
jgi:hypothetical protein